MLLSNIINLTKYKNNINESFKGNENLFRKYTNQFKQYIPKNSQLSETCYYIHTLANAIVNAQENNDLNLNDIDVRQNILSSLPSKKQNISFTKLLLNCSYQLHNIAVDNITNDDFEEIPLNKVRSKKYSNYLMFWENPEGTLVAITTNTEVQALIKSTNYYNFKVNKDYQSENIPNFKELPWYVRDDKIDNWIKNAYIATPIYSFSTNIDKDYKKVLSIMKYIGNSGYYSLTGFKNGISHIYGLSVDKLYQKYNINDKVSERNAYNNFLNIDNSIKERLKKYKALSLYKRTLKEFELLKNTCDNNIQIINDSYLTLNKIVLSIMSNPDNIDKMLVEEINNLFELYNALITKCIKILESIEQITKIDLNYKTNKDSYYNIDSYLSSIKYYISEYNYKIDIRLKNYYYQKLLSFIYSYKDKPFFKFQSISKCKININDVIK